MLEIRPADIRDLFALRALERACFGPDAWGFIELTAALLSPGIRLKATASNHGADPGRRDGERVVGFAVGETRAWAQEGWIATLGVHPEFRRRGIGRQLLAALETRLKPPTIKLTVRASNAPAQSLYTQFGYRPVGRIARYYSGGEDGIVMEKRRR
jgi:ribosomal-protein-alanine N-acetyltransferase